MIWAPRIPLPVFEGEPPADPAAASVLGYQPELLRAFQVLYGTLWQHGVVDHPTKEVARLRNARITDCGY